jgi:hypothetical protein
MEESGSNKQRPFLKEYIELNTRLRNEAKKNKDSLGDLVYKTMNNALTVWEDVSEPKKVWELGEVQP